MNKKIIPIALTLLFAGAMNAQVGVGTLNPNGAAQLEVVASNKGILIPNVSLSSTTDTTTITAGNVSSLLVFNTATAGSGATMVKPGYYYWFGNSWKRLVTADEVAGGGISTTDVLVANSNGTYTHTAVDGTVVTIDVAGDAVTAIVNDINNGGNVYNALVNEITEQVTNQAGDIYNQIINAIGTDTLVNNNNGTYTHTAVNGTAVTIDVVGDVLGEIQNNSSDIHTAIQDMINAVIQGNTLLNGAGAPASTVGADGDFYIDTTNNEIYGPKTGGAWGSGTPMIGQNGQDGVGVQSTVDNGNGTFTITYTDGSTFTSSDLTGPQGPQGPAGPGGSTIVNDDNQVTTLVTGDGSNATPYKVEVRSALVTLSADETLSAGHNIVYVDASNGNVEIELPDPSTMKGKSFKVAKADTDDTKSVTVKTTGSVELFNTVANQVKNFIPSMGWEFTTDGTKWYITNKF